MSLLYQPGVLLARRSLVHDQVTQAEVVRAYGRLGALRIDHDGQDMVAGGQLCEESALVAHVGAPGPEYQGGGWAVTAPVAATDRATNTTTSATVSVSASARASGRCGRIKIEIERGMFHGLFHVL